MCLILKMWKDSKLDFKILRYIKGKKLFTFLLAYIKNTIGRQIEDLLNHDWSLKIFQFNEHPPVFNA